MGNADARKQESARKIKLLRHQLGLSQQKFGALYNIPCARISQWECGYMAPPDYVIYMMEQLALLKFPDAFDDSYFEEKELGCRTA